MKWGASNKFEKLREISRLHQLWAAYVIVGPDSISKSEYVELKRSHLPTDTFLCLPYKAYLLGKAEAQVRPSLRKSLDVDLSKDTLTSEDYIRVRQHEERLASVIKGLLSAELEGNYDLLNGSKPDLRSLVVKCLQELKVIKNSAYVSSIQNCEGVYSKSLGNNSHIVSTGAIHKVMQVSELPERNLHDLIFLPEDMAKAVGSPTVAPAGPEGPRKEAASRPPAAGSMKGAPAAGQTAGPGRPPGTGDDVKTIAADDMTNCPYGGDDDCKAAGGSGSKRHIVGGVSMTRHAEARAAGNNPPTEEGDKELVQQEIRDTVAYDRLSHPHSKILYDLNNGEIGSEQNVASSPDAAAGQTEAYVVSIIGGGRGLAKPSVVLPRSYLDNEFPITGGGSVPMDKSVGREAATYGASMLHGSSELVPPTTTRSHGGRPMSIQQWKEGYSCGDVAVGIAAGDTNNQTLSFLNLVPAASKDKIKSKLNQLIVNTIVTNDTDKHFGNIVVNEDFSDFAAIDGGFSFGNSMAGCKNTIQQDMHNAGMKVKIDQQAQTRLANLSFKDYRQAVGGDVEDWAVGQSFLRNRYMLYLQETEGEIDYEKFRTTAGTIDDGNVAPHGGMWKNLPHDEFDYRKDNGLLPSQLFDTWSKGYLEEASNDPSHSDHEDAKTLSDLGVFMGPGFARNPEKYRKEGKHIEYAKTIQANMDIPKVIRRDSKKTTTHLDQNTTKTTIHDKDLFDPFPSKKLDTNTVDPKADTQLDSSTKVTRPRRKR